jgi:hypothetical protein
VFEFVVVVDRGVLCSPRFCGAVTLVSDCQVVLLRSFLRILSVKSLGCCGRLSCNRIYLPRLDRSRGVDSTASSYKPGPQARYLVEKMPRTWWRRLTGWRRRWILMTRDSHPWVRISRRSHRRSICRCAPFKRSRRSRCCCCMR